MIVGERRERELEKGLVRPGLAQPENSSGDLVGCSQRAPPG